MADLCNRPLSRQKKKKGWKVDGWMKVAGSAYVFFN